MIKNKISIFILMLLAPSVNLFPGVTTGSYAKTKKALPICHTETSWKDDLKDYLAKIDKLPEKEQVPALKKEVENLRKKLHEITKSAKIDDKP